MKHFILLPDPASPLVHIDLALLFGAVQDPPGKDGLSSLAMSMLLRGTERKTAAEFHRCLDDLGAELHIGKYKESMRIYGVVLNQNLDRFLELLEEMITEPRFDAAEFAKIKSQVQSSLLEELGSDDEIAERRFQEYFLWGHPYGRITAGSLDTLGGITLEDTKDFYRRYFRSDAFVCGATGSFDRARLTKRLQAILKRLPKSEDKPLVVSAPDFPSGRRVILLDKPGRSQSQLYIGAPGLGIRDPDYASMQIANHIFGGGSFSARLMHEVREKRGWSYGAYSSFRSGRQPLYFVMHAVPSNKDTVPALSLMRDLYEGFHKKGVSKTEFEFAKKSLLNQAAFLQDTMRKRLDNKMSEIILGLPAGFYDSYRKRIQGVTYPRAQAAIKRQTHPKTLFALVLCTAGEIRGPLGGTKGWDQVLERPYDQSPQRI